jgi:hypothetical protein
MHSSHKRPSTNKTSPGGTVTVASSPLLLTTSGLLLPLCCPSHTAADTIGCLDTIVAVTAPERSSFHAFSLERRRCTLASA